MMTSTSFDRFLMLIGAAAVAACAGSAERPPSTSHEHEHEHEGESHAGAVTGGPHEVTEDERAAYEKARPIFEKYCIKCHTTEGSAAKPMALHHFDMDTYPFGGHHASEITAAIREVLGATGKPPTMPRDEPGAVKGEELALILAWADAYDRAHASAGTSEMPHHDEHGGSEHEHQHEHEGAEDPH